MLAIDVRQGILKKPTYLNRDKTAVAAKRIAILAPFFPRPSPADEDQLKKGGVERYVAELAAVLPSLGFDITVVAPAEEPGIVKNDNFTTLYFNRIGVAFGSPLFNPAALLRRLKGYDLVHSQATYPLLSDLPPLFSRMARINSVVTYHFEPYPPSPIGRALGELYLATLAKMIRRYDRVIFSSRTYWEESRLASHYDARDVRFIPMGVDTDFFVPDPETERENRFLFVGRLVPYKDIPLLLRAMRTVNEALPDFELAIVGSGPLEGNLVAMARSLGVRARFLGRVDDEALRRLYQTSTATVLASHNRQEAFGMTLLESMSCGTPVIAADIPGVREVASLSGMPVKPESDQALAEAMIESTRRPIDAARSRDLRERVIGSYSWRHVAEKTASVYRELL